jgi:hypothetical protein
MRVCVYMLCVCVCVLGKIRERWIGKLGEHGKRRVEFHHTRQTKLFEVETHTAATPSHDSTATTHLQPDHDRGGLLVCRRTRGILLLHATISE